VIINPRAMENMPRTWITSFRLPPQHADFGTALLREYPNLTVVDIESVVQQVQDVVGQVIAAVEFLFLFTLASGLLVLVAALLGSQDERMREAALLRALGATRAQLTRAQRIEFLLLGAVSGLMAAAGAAVVGWLLAKHAFGFDWAFSPAVWLAGLAAGAACAAAGGWAGLRKVLHHPPLQSLREV